MLSADYETVVKNAEVFEYFLKTELNKVFQWVGGRRVGRMNEWQAERYSERGLKICNTHVNN